MTDDIISKITDKNDRLLLKQVIDKYNLFRKKNISTYTNFLNKRELKFIEDYLKYLNIEYNKSLLFNDQEKFIIYFGNYDNFISIYEIDNNQIRHKDVLGSLFNIGYRDNMIGDIFIQDKVYFTNLEKYDNLLINELNKIGKYNVELKKLDYIPDVKQYYQNKELNLNSLRIDLLISKLASISRSKTLSFIKEKNIYINYKELNNTSTNIKEDDIISIEGIGKFIIDEIILNEKTQKFKIKFRKYS